MINPVTRMVILATIVFFGISALIIGIVLRTGYNSEGHSVTRVNIVRGQTGMPLGVRRFGIITNNKFRIVDDDTFKTYTVDKSVVRSRRINAETQDTFAQLDMVFDPPIHRVTQFYLHLDAGEAFSACGTKMFVTYANGIVKEYAIPTAHHGRAWVYRNHRRQPVRPRSPVDNEMYNDRYDTNCNI